MFVTFRVLGSGLSLPEWPCAKGIESFDLDDRRFRFFADGFSQLVMALLALPVCRWLGKLPLLASGVDRATRPLD